MIPYAGHERREASRAHRAYLMFRAGRDTMQIAEHYRVKEHRVLKWINMERSRRRGLACPYRKAVAA